MGKSPAKWIKAVLLGKKSSKSSYSKNVIVERQSATKASAGDTVPVVSDPSFEAIDRGGENVQLEKGTSASLPSDVAASLPVNESVDFQGGSGSNIAVSAEMTMEEQAATKAQAAFRGYLARRAFRALKGIIRLQALIRGHLVRRQAVATLHCMQAIVKFQAFARGRKVRILYPGHQVLGKNRLAENQDTKREELLGANMSQKLATNTFVRKLLASSPTAMPLSLQYDLAEPNSAWNWLERWSLLCFWEPLPQPKKIVDTKPKTKQATSQAVETQTGRSKRTIRKVPAVTNSDNNASNSVEIEKPKRSVRKIINHQTESVQEQPQNELERVKRSLRKVSASATMLSEKSEIETEKAQEGLKNASNLDVSDLGGVESSEKSSSEAPPKLSSSEAPPKLSVTEAASKLSLTEALPKLSLTEAVPKLSTTEPPSETLTADESENVMQEGHLIENNLSENGEKVQLSHPQTEDLSSKDEQTNKENQKTRRRRSLPTKQEYPENVSQNTRSVPSYMAATESAKAKLRAQAAAALGEEGNDTENGFIRRHSLPSSTNGKLASVSPRVHKPLQANGKGGIKINKSLSSSRDDKALPGWRR